MSILLYMRDWNFTDLTFSILGWSQLVTLALAEPFVDTIIS